MLESKNYRNPCKCVEGGKRTGTTRKNACDRETMVKIRLAIIFIIAQVVLTKHTSRRSTNIVVEDRAIRCNRNAEASCLSNKLLASISSSCWPRSNVGWGNQTSCLEHIKRARCFSPEPGNHLNCRKQHQLPRF